MAVNVNGSNGRTRVRRGTPRTSAIPQVRRASVRIINQGGFTVTADGTDARVACMRCPMTKRVADDDGEINAVKEAHVH
jgi:hypothetical protein